MTIIQKAIEYLRSSKAEMLKVSWPSRRDTLRYGSLVIGISVVVSALFATLDSGFTSLFDATILRYAKTSQQTEQVPMAPVAPTVEAVTEEPVTVTDQPSINLEDATPIETPKQ
jgi:preprotein translocase SecE subunit